MAFAFGLARFISWLIIAVVALFVMIAIVFMAFASVSNPSTGLSIPAEIRATLNTAVGLANLLIIVGILGVIIYLLLTRLGFLQAGGGE